MTTTREGLCFPLISRWGLNPLLWFERNPDFTLAPQEEACLTYQNSKGNLLLLHQERRMSSPSTGDKAWSTSTVSNGTLSNHSQHEWRSDLPVAPLAKAQVPRLNSIGGLTPLYNSRGKWISMPQQEMRPDSHVETWEEPRNSCCKWRGTLSFPPQIQMWHCSPAASQVESRGAPCNSKFPWEVPWCPCLNSRGTEPSHHDSRKTPRFPSQC